jgi:hypothetical protein
MNEPRRTLVITSDIPHRKLESLMPASLAGGSWRILYNPPRGTECDFWIVFSVVRDREWMRCAPQNTLYLAGEPPSKKIHPEAFYAQFARVVSLHPADPHPAVEVECPCLNWHVGLDHRTHTYRIGHADLQKMPPPPKERKISVVCSSLRTTPGQRRRLALLDALKQDLGDRLVHFGRGFEPIGDKLDAILPYAAHLVLENEQTPHYWTEKLVDAYLGFAHPFYLGAPNVGDYFPSASFTVIDADQPESAAVAIRRFLESGTDHPSEAVCTARERVLDRYNFFSNAVRLASRHFRPAATADHLEIWSHKAFRPFPKNLLFRWRRGKA